MNDVNKLADLLEQEQSSLLEEWRSIVRELPSAKNLDVPTLNDHIPELLEELAKSLRSRKEVTIIEALATGSPPYHGLQRLRDGYDIAEVVSEYNILRACVHQLAEANEITMTGRAFSVLNQVLDHAIGLAVQAFASQRAFEVRQKREEHLSFVAHDLRSPLNAISLSVQLLQHQIPASVKKGKTAHTLETLKRNVEQVNAMVVRILQENRDLNADLPSRLDRSRFALCPLVDDVIEDLQPQLDSSRTTFINEIPETLTIDADRSLLTRIFVNLASNAIEYTPDGEVTIQATVDAPSDTVTCRLSDNGSGIPAEFVDKVFTKLETDPDKRNGYGLGLAIVKQFVEAHGGDIRVESEEGVGTTFQFTIPPGDESVSF